MRKIILGITSLALSASCSTYKTIQNNKQTIEVRIDLNTAVNE